MIKIAANKLLWIAIVFLFIVGCDVFTPKVTVKGYSFSSYLSIEFFDLATGELIGIDDLPDVDFSFSGDDANLIRNCLDERITDGKATDGLADFYFRDDVVPTVSDPVRLVLHAECEGYLPVVLPIDITATGFSKERIPMVSYDNPPDGVTSEYFQNFGVTNNSGVLQNSVTLTMTTGEAIVTIPAGLVMRDENGSLVSGDINARILYFDPENRISQLAFPGGFNVTVKRDGVEMNGIFISSGLVTLELVNSEGKVVCATDNGKIHVSITLDPSWINPNTGLEYQIGDNLDTWSYNMENGIWDFQGVSVVRSTKSLSFKNAQTLYIDFDFGIYRRIYYGNCDTYIDVLYNSCYSINAIDLNSNIEFTNFYIGVAVEIDYNNLKRYGFRNVLINSDQSFAVTGYRPVGSSGKITLYPFHFLCNPFAPIDSEVNFIVDNFCANESFSASIEFQTLEKITMEVLMHCPDNEMLYFEPTFVGYYKVKNSDCWLTAPFVNGKTSVYVLPGYIYTVATIIDGRFEPWEIDVQKDGDNLVINHDSDMAEDGSSSVIFAPNEERYVSYIIQLTERSCEKMDF